ncbi:hypothetical protein BDM02DRAFT_3118860, partial [Thelephora ganbajun]
MATKRTEGAPGNRPVAKTSRQVPAGKTERPVAKSPCGYNQWLRLALASSVRFTASGGPTL